ncbi:glycine-rich domain-containing protein [Streptomyces sp. NPDC048639]|uniref:glycine-rich domain-containing protein n=1 Tax=Streptomyces sp. NPDC048639 TaxID=3365581 RepID=UPI003720325E
MTITAERPFVTATDPRTLLGSELVNRLATRIVKDHPGIDLPFADRIVTQTAAFLAACGDNTGQPLSPSGSIDVGWHTFILHTREYAAFCQRIAGHFVHHVPTDPDEGEEGTAAAARQRTLEAITAADYTVDLELWPEMSDCSQCHAGCSDSPNSGKSKQK